MSVPRKYESISKYNFMGYEYVKLDELNALIREMRKKTREGKEPGYMNEDRQQRIAAELALNHLSVVLNKEKIHVQTIERVMKTRIEREAKEQAKAKVDVDDLKGIPARYTVWKGATDGGMAADALCFVRWEDKRPVFGNCPCNAMWFVEEVMAEKTAEKLGEGWEVVDMWPVMTKEQRLLRALLSDDCEDDECGYCGDGTAAEDEDWDGAHE